MSAPLSFFSREKSFSLPLYPPQPWAKAGYRSQGPGTGPLSSTALGEGGNPFQEKRDILEVRRVPYRLYLPIEGTEPFL